MRVAGTGDLISKSEDQERAAGEVSPGLQRGRGRHLDCCGEKQVEEKGF